MEIPFRIRVAFSGRHRFYPEAPEQPLASFASTAHRLVQPPVQVARSAAARGSTHCARPTPSSCCTTRACSAATPTRAGRELLGRLQAATRPPEGAPHGLWLLCPGESATATPQLDGMVVEVIDASERITLDLDALDELPPVDGAA